MSSRSVEVDQYEICGMSRAPVIAAVVVETELRPGPMTTSVPEVRSPSARTDLATVPPLSSSRKRSCLSHPANVPNAGRALAFLALKSVTAVKEAATTVCIVSVIQHAPLIHSPAQVS